MDFFICRVAHPISKKRSHLSCLRTFTVFNHTDNDLVCGGRLLGVLRILFPKKVLPNEGDSCNSRRDDCYYRCEAKHSVHLFYDMCLAKSFWKARGYWGSISEERLFTEARTAVFRTEEGVELHYIFKVWFLRKLFDIIDCCCVFWFPLLRDNIVDTCGKAAEGCILVQQRLVCFDENKLAVGC